MLLERERERWEQTKLTGDPFWMRVLRKSCYSAAAATVIFAGWWGLTSAVHEGTTTTWLYFGYLVFLGYIICTIISRLQRGAALLPLFTSMGPAEGVAAFLGMFWPQLLLDDPAQFTATVTLTAIFLFIPWATVLLIRVRRFV